MEPETKRNIRLGIFVTVGTLFLVVAFYFVGSKQNLFGSTFHLTAHFHNVNGLMQGNNVRFAGIDVGTVESLVIENDSSVRVIMVLDKNIQKFIRQGDLASVGTDGLMGNKLVNIDGGGRGTAAVEEGDELKTRPPLEMDEMVRTLNVTNNNMASISSNLNNFTQRINSKNNLWKLLMDTVVADNIKSAVVNLKRMSESGRNMAQQLESVTGKLSGNRSGLTQLVGDTQLYGKIVRTVNDLEKTSDSARMISGDLAVITRDLRHGKGSLGRALQDTMLVYKLDKGLGTVDSAAYNFNENMKALQHTWPLKKYFRKRAQGKKK